MSILITAYLSVVALVSIALPIWLSFKFFLAYSPFLLMIGIMIFGSSFVIMPVAMLNGVESYDGMMLVTLLAGVLGLWTMIRWSYQAHRFSKNMKQEWKL